MDPDRALLDFHHDLSHMMDACGFTEVAHFQRQLQVACLDRGYRLLLPPEGDTAIAVSDAHELLDHDYLHVNAGQPGPMASGGHSPRGVQVVQFRPFGTEEVVTFATAHWLTRRADDGGQRLAMTQAMAHTIQQAAKGSRLGFWAGDTNNPDQPGDVSEVDRLLRKGQLTSCWDELGRYPATHGHTTLDVVGSYDPDGRVSCTRARVWPQLRSDHRPISAWYSVRPEQRRR
jgi:hypothetical protein